MNAVYQATLKLLEADPNLKSVQVSLDEGLSRLSKSPSTATVRDLEKALKSSVYKQLQVILPPANAKNLVQSLINQLSDLELLENAPATPASAAAAAPSSVGLAMPGLTPLEAGLKRFNLYFEWPEVQKFRSQLTVLRDQQILGRDAPDLLRDAGAQLEALERKLQDLLVRQAQDIAELKTGFERVKTIGGPRVKRLESLIDQITDAQGSATLAPAEVERARKLVVDLRKLIESSVVNLSPAMLDEAIEISEPRAPAPGKETGEILEVEFAAPGASTKSVPDPALSVAPEVVMEGAPTQPAVPHQPDLSGHDLNAAQLSGVSTSATDDDSHSIKDSMLDIEFEFPDLELTPEQSERVREIELAEETRALESLEVEYRGVLAVNPAAKAQLEALVTRNQSQQVLQDDVHHFRVKLLELRDVELERQKIRLREIAPRLDLLAAAGLEVNDARLTLSVAEGTTISGALASDDLNKLEDALRTLDRQFEERERARAEEQARNERLLARQENVYQQFKAALPSFTVLGTQVLEFQHHLEELERETAAKHVRDDLTKTLGELLGGLETGLEQHQAAQRAEAERIERVRLEAEAKAKAEAEAKAAAEAEVRAKAEAGAREEVARLERERQDAEARAKAEAERMAREREEAALRAKAEADAKIEAQRMERERQEAEERARVEAERLERERLELEARAKAEAEARAAAEAAAKLEAERLERERQEAEAKAEAERIAAEHRAQIGRESGAMRSMRLTLAAFPDLDELSSTVTGLENAMTGASQRLERGELVTDSLNRFKAQLETVRLEALSVYARKLSDLEVRAREIAALELIEDINTAHEDLDHGAFPDLAGLEGSLRAQREARLSAQSRELSELENALREYSLLPEAKPLLETISAARHQHEAGALLSLSGAWDRLEQLRILEDTLRNGWRNRTEALIEEAHVYKSLGGETTRQLAQLVAVLASEPGGRILPETRLRLTRTLEEAEKLLVTSRQEYEAASAVAAALQDSGQIDDLLGVLGPIFKKMENAPQKPFEPPAAAFVAAQTAVEPVSASGSDSLLHRWIADLSRERGVGRIALMNNGTLESGNVTDPEGLAKLLAEMERYNLDLSMELKRKPARLYTVEYAGGAALALYLRSNASEAPTQSQYTIVIQLEDMAVYSRIFSQAQKDFDQLVEWAAQS